MTKLKSKKSEKKLKKKHRFYKTQFLFIRKAMRSTTD